jgi:hypothetical protein
VVWFKSFLYQAASWTTPRRVVAKVEFHCGELFPRVGFIVTNLAAASRAVVCFYNKRGTPEQWIKEGKQAVKLIKHARYYWLLLTESHLTQRLFTAMLRKITALPSPAG